MVTALANGADAILPVAEISEALDQRRQSPSVLLAGERNGFRIGADLTGRIEFDFGNSPREFGPDKVRGRRLVMTTTNGTRALRSCAGAREILVGSFLNLSVVASALRQASPSTLLLVCSGTHDEVAYEDALAAGALCDLLWSEFEGGHVTDSAQIARQIFRTAAGDLLKAVQCARNARRLSAIPELAGDIQFCLQRDQSSIVPRMGADGWVTI